MIANNNNSKKVNPFFYIITGGVILGLLSLGSLYKHTQNVVAESIMFSLGVEGNIVSIDRLSEMRTIADVASNLDLATKSYINMDYVSVSTQYSIDQAGVVRLEKPNIVDTSDLSRGVREHIVKEGENFDALAEKYKITPAQLKFSNHLSENKVTPGQKILVPVVAGIIYTTKAGDNLEAIAKRFNSPIDQIISYNDLEGVTGSLAPNTAIILPAGKVPEESSNTGSIRTHKKPTYKVYYPTSAGNPLPYGWCTWYAWEWRKQNMPWNYHLPSGNLGDAKYWDENLAGRYIINKTPTYGDVFQDDFSSIWGHVGIVTAVNNDGSITIKEMNGPAGWGREGTRNIPKAQWQGWDFIHQAVGT